MNDLNSASLYNRILEMNEPSWNYYAPSANNISLRKPFVSNVSAVEFILAYFQKGGKNLITDAFDVTNFGRPRAEHTVSIFFLGVVLYHNTAFRDQVFYEGRVNNRFDFFAFIWFVTCLAHDFTIYRERDEDLLGSCQTLEELRRYHSIEYDLLSQAHTNVPLALHKAIACYYNLRVNEGRVDHGISAGMIVYDVLVKNRRDRQAARDIDWLWEDYLDQEYVYAAATIAVHNIWLPDSGRLPRYISFGLEELAKQKRFRFSEGPLYHLLSIVDTLDPVKMYGDVRTGNQVVADAAIAPKPDAATILRHVFLSFPNTRTFRLTVSAPLDPEPLITAGKGLSKFLQVRVTPLKEGVSVFLYCK